MINISTLIEQGSLYHVFQPLRRLPDSLCFGYEALIRCKSGASPDRLFTQASEQGQLLQLDIWSIQNALSRFFRSAGTHDKDELLFVNLFPSTIVSGEFQGFMEGIMRQFTLNCRRIVLEINESIIEGRIWDNPLFAETINWLRHQGFMIALDDVGEGAVTFRKIVEISPDFIKIDRFFSKELSVSSLKQKVIRLFVEYCRDNAVLILEGIEHEEDLEQASLLGVKVGQGYYLGKPAQLPFR